eukprot:CAMPEP_0117501476 /NCGR_PEP_ID=MMETSP0784-20121206/23317_1 /TAXON_ID=39447 /ORGANISM="" /LENGTH=82 /DNA_ID=CAMNT_0005296729 /DNA_START=1481 /DNA_END=1729 /DNA_ORIENTATION=+
MSPDDLKSGSTSVFSPMTSCNKICEIPARILGVSQLAAATLRVRFFPPISKYPALAGFSRQVRRFADTPFQLKQLCTKKAAT